MFKNILVVAAHPDDEVLGCGGAIARHRQHGDRVRVIFIADGVGARLANFEDSLKERKNSAYSALRALDVDSIEFFDFPDNQLDTIPLLSIIQKIESTVKEFNPEIVYTHHYGDLNIDHALIAKACITACRPLPDSSVKTLLFFEVLSATHWGIAVENFKPNYYIDIKDFFDQKMSAIKCYVSEMRNYPHCRSVESIKSLCQHRGSQVGLDLAEAFETFRILVK
ncbi:MAG: PIG-L family deacetylase [Proteobacteria bacterium]|nr:PIG-L family deacetylase [Pseudomonadota bacterium]